MALWALYLLLPFRWPTIFCCDYENFIITVSNSSAVSLIHTSHLLPWDSLSFGDTCLSRKTPCLCLNEELLKRNFLCTACKSPAEKFCQMHESSVSTRVAAPSSLMKKAPEEAPFNPQGLALMPALALVKGKTSQRLESIGSREAVCRLPTQRPTEKGKQSFSASSNKDETFAREAFSFVLRHYFTGHFSYGEIWKTLVLLWLFALNDLVGLTLKECYLSAERRCIFLNRCCVWFPFTPNPDVLFKSK